MSVDLWTKLALTVIAVCLAVIAWKLPLPMLVTLKRERVEAPAPPHAT
jgi:hypothetical protein